MGGEEDRVKKKGEGGVVWMKRGPGKEWRGGGEWGGGDGEAWGGGESGKSAKKESRGGWGGRR